MRAGRLISIVLLLQNYRKLTSKELAEQLEVSERTIVRDMEALSGAGVPVYAERGAQGGWGLTEGYRTNLTGMRAEELASMLIAAQAGLLGDLGLAGHVDTAIQKLLAAAPGEASANAADVRLKIHIDGAGWHQTFAKNQLDLLPVVQEAVWANRKLKLTYLREGIPTERIVHPLGLVAKRSVWYLVAQTDLSHIETLRTYRISRLVNADILAEAFLRPHDFDLAAYWEQSIGVFKDSLPKYPVTARVKAAIISRLDRERYVKVASSQPDGVGWVRAELDCQTLASATEILMGYGGSICVLEPEELREQVVAGLREALSHYEQE